MRDSEATSASSGTVTDQPALRSDARRNREKLLAAAAETFAASGVNASLEEIARQAGVGVGTLYRHFPSREALVAATYRHEVEQLCESVGDLQASLAPDAALRAWMDGFVHYTAAKRGMGEALQAVMASDSALYADAYAKLVAALDALLATASAAGTIRSDARGDDVLRALAAIWMIRDSANREQQAGRVLNLLMDGLRYDPSRASG
jgi:AcrR family transcriptional regulator